MITVHEARSLILQKTGTLAPITLPLQNALGLTLANDIVAQYDIPAYPQSSMDGYAIRFEERTGVLKISGEMAAGASQPFDLGPGTAARIFTGAPLPEGADTVVMQENTSVQNGTLTIADPNLKKGLNVRPRGAEIQKGTVAMSKGCTVTVAATGFLAGIGVAHATVFPSPKTTIILTGNELQSQDNPPAFGKVYESNSFMLGAALRLAGVRHVNIVKAEDNIHTLTGILNTALQDNDLVLLTGGVSVGDYDYVIDAAKLSGIETVFHRVKQKPGKPLYFGTKDKKLVFGLPGNPSSALTCFYIYVLPAIEAMMKKTGGSVTVNGRLTADFKKVPGLTQFLKAKISDEKVTLLHAQESFRLHSFAQANCLAELDAETDFYAAGSEVTVHLLPG